MNVYGTTITRSIGESIYAKGIEYDNAHSSREQMRRSEGHSHIEDYG